MGNSAPETLNVRSTPDQATIFISDEAGTKIYEGKLLYLAFREKESYFSGNKYTVNIKKKASLSTP